MNMLKYLLIVEKVTEELEYYFSSCPLAKSVTDILHHI